MRPTLFDSGASGPLFAAARARACALSVCGLLACSPDGPSSMADGPPPAALPILWQSADTMPVAATDAPPALCARAGDDVVRDVFCRAGAAPIRDLLSLQSALGVNTFPPISEDVPLPPGSPPPTDLVVFLGLSTALSGHLVSPINPRVILMGGPTQLAFQRGSQKVELVSLDRATNALNFYLLSFTQACNRTPGGCTPGDLFTPRIETAWERVRLDDADDLENTPLDCRQCHQRGRAQPILLMREHRAPWTHFFSAITPGAAPVLGVTGSDLLRDFLDAQGDEPYANVPVTYAKGTAGFFLEGTVERLQPLFFDSALIDLERGTYDPPAPSAVLRRSPTWDRAYAAFKRGEQLALPHFDARPVDPAKFAQRSEAYRRYRAGELPAEALPDLADVFPDDPQQRAEIGLQTEPDATPAEALIQACAPCHNDVLNQTISRARFNVALSRLDARARAVAVERLTRPPSDPGVMPPAGARALPPAVRARLIAYLRSNVRPAEDDALLDHAAELGMMGGGR